jgi:IclR family transcriptional regulator, positive regulator for flagellar biogenesis
MFVRDSESNRSLTRGLAVLRAFRPGNASLSTTEIAERTGIPPATVSRLLATLVREGFLTYDFDIRAYSMGVPVLSLAEAYTESSRLLQEAQPLMTQLARRQCVNVGIGTEDCGGIVYLQSVRGNTGTAFRRIMSGSRAPLEISAIGLAWLAGAPPELRREKLAGIAARYGRKWAQIQAGIVAAEASFREFGYCVSRWQAGSVAIARPLAPAQGQLFAVNLSYREATSDERFLREQAARLMELAAALDALSASRG